MFDRDLGAAAVSCPPADPLSLIQFYSIELMPTADGCFSVGVVATICEREGELESMEMASERVTTIDEALAVIREALILKH